MYIYSNPERESETYALPNVEIFWHDGDSENAPSWYYWYCFPGCMPDSEMTGPFPTIENAKSYAQSQED